MLKKLAGAALCVASVVGMSGPAFAGEITGSGKGGPNKNGIPAATQNGHASECAFSGLEDDPALTGSKVQNFGHPDDPFFANAVVTRGASVVAIPIEGGTLMLGCNKNLSGVFIPD